MLTKNFTLLETAVIAKRTGNGGFVPDYVINTDGNKVYPVNNYSMMTDLNALFNITNKKVSELGNTTNVGTFAFGAGTTEAKKSDVDLENTISESGFAITSATRQFEEDRTTLKQQITYSGSDEITISELGYFYNYGTSNGGSVYYFPILIAREVIQPITIRRGDTFQISMIIG